MVLDYFNNSWTLKGVWINNGSGWEDNPDWASPEPFTNNGKNVGRRIGDVNGDGIPDIIIGYNDGTGEIKRTVIRNQTIPFLLKNVTTEFGGLTSIYYSASTLFNNSGDDGRSHLGFNIWVVRTVLQNNGLVNGFDVNSNTTYWYFGGLYNNTD